MMGGAAAASGASVETRAAWLAGYDANARRAADWIHASWHGALAPLVAAMQKRAPAQRAACSLLLLRTLGGHRRRSTDSIRPRTGSPRCPSPTCCGSCACARC
ncbi:bacterial type III secretion family protein [Burkholderia thailandensis]|uniref:Bacterial type III secretion family protein n=1 Tax=Burkholderia thailandensis TaxID=57975 RepID=A0AAW9CU44_BURTH|nr:bacterial type III secretion family protein [Burkholderia thailandensis]